MAQVAERNADKLVITSDNPRTESAHNIIEQIVAGLSAPARVQVQIDRAAAIAYAVSTARVNDVVLIAGKGAEEYQDIAGVKHPFNDLAHARTALQGNIQGAAA
jgi:UDP-N-acetylmuramyl tripeptide synthase